MKKKISAAYQSGGSRISENGSMASGVINRKGGSVSSAANKRKRYHRQRSVSESESGGGSKSENKAAYNSGEKIVAKHGGNGKRKSIKRRRKATAKGM